MWFKFQFFFIIPIANEMLINIIEDKPKAAIACFFDSCIFFDKPTSSIDVWRSVSIPEPCQGDAEILSLSSFFVFSRNF
jgi:hypothetical protein